MLLEDRVCKDCILYPCMPNFAEFNFNFASAGCRDYVKSDEYINSESTGD